MNTLTIARLTFREAARRRILLAGLILGLLFLAIYGLGFHFIIGEAEVGFTDDLRREMMINQISNFLMMAGMYVVNMLTAMMTVLTSVDTLSGEISTGTVHTLLSKPVRRWEIVTGKWLGFAGMLILYLVLMGGGVMAIVYMRTGYSAPHPLTALALMVFTAAILLSVSLLGGSSLSTLANGVLVFGLFGVAFIGGWIEQIGAFLPDQATGRTAINIGVVTSLIMPSDALWKSAAHQLQSPLLNMVAGMTPFSSQTYPSTVMLIYSGVYLAAVFALAVRRFSRRDL
jgi:ABC-type transport system involved in multi-copper enzyme maturation permease subunit